MRVCVIVIVVVYIMAYAYVSVVERGESTYLEVKVA